MSVAEQLPGNGYRRLIHPLVAGFKPFLVNPLEGFGIAQLIIAGVSMALSLAAYAWKWGLWFGAGVIALIAIHELGHAVAIRASGLRAGAMVFIPFVGGAVTLRGQPRSVYGDAKIGLAGPIVGTAASVALLFIYRANENPLFLGFAYAGFILNLFNLLPVGPLDGGRVAAAITKWMWLGGILILLWMTIRFRSLFLLIVLLLGVLHMYGAVTRRHERFYTVTLPQRGTIAAVYFSLVLFLSYETAATYRELQQLF